ncbi:MAG: hypothetical protein IIX10_01005, partial [Clostridia bacterium]|nr:hypothetical protein [Clostridia bacterium]
MAHLVPATHKILYSNPELIMRTVRSTSMLHLYIDNMDLSNLNESQLNEIVLALEKSDYEINEKTSPILRGNYNFIISQMNKSKGYFGLQYV